MRMEPQSTIGRNDGTDLEPDLMLPAQFFARRCTGTLLRPEQRLALAVLEDAVAAFQTNATAKHEQGRRYYAEAAAWLTSDDTSWPFSFVNVCHAVGLDPESIRSGLRRWSMRQQAAGETRLVVRFPFNRYRDSRCRIVA